MPLLRNQDTTDTIYFTSEMDAEWEDSVEVSTNAIPQGEPATTHKERKPRTYSLRLMVSDAPLQRDLPPGGATPPGERWDSLVEAWLGRNLMGRLDYISPSTGLVRGVDITSVRRGRKGALLHTVYDVQLTQARFAVAQTVQLPPPKRQKKKTTNPPEEKGPTPTTEAPNKYKSADARVYDGVVTDSKNTVNYRLRTTYTAVGDQSSVDTGAPDGAELTSSYQYSGPASRQGRNR